VVTAGRISANLAGRIGGNHNFVHLLRTLGCLAMLIPREQGHNLAQRMAED
jgi:hypothetical protein